MENQEKLLEICKRIIETQLSWGSSELWTNQDYEKLSIRIFDATGVNLSAATLKRIWGKIRYESKPTNTTLNTLAKFAGYEDWRNFALRYLAVKVEQTEYRDIQNSQVVSKKNFRKQILVIAAAGVILVIFAFLYSRFKPQKTKQLQSSDFSFTSKKVVSEGVPNTVIFDYDASAAHEEDTIFIQQSWDPRLREQVSKADRQHTSIYFYPGFFQAKLVVNNQIVKEHNLFIKTNGWLAMADTKPVPVYFEKEEVLHDGILQLPVSVLKANNIPLQPAPVWMNYYNVGGYTGLKNDSLAFEASLRNDYNAGAAACQYTEAHLLFAGSALIIPLSAKGCVSTLNLFGKDGKKNDLSALGVDFTNSVKLRVEIVSKDVMILIDGHEAFRFPYEMPHANLVGVLFRFQGSGSVDYLKVSDLAEEIVYEDDFAVK